MQNSVEDENVVEVLSLPDKSTIVIGHFDPLRMNPLMSSWPVVLPLSSTHNCQRTEIEQHRESYGLCSLPQPTGSWLCRFENKADLWIQDPERTQVYFPRPFPIERCALR